MATSLFLSNFLSFRTTSKPPTKAPPLTISFFPSAIKTHKPQHAVVSMATREPNPSSSPALSAVTCPSLAHSNILFFKSAYNVQVIVDENEPEERLLNRFRREVMRAGVIQECKRRKFHENKQEEKKRKTREAAKRNRRRRTGSRFIPQSKQEESSSAKKVDEEEDNWDMPSESLPA